MTPSKPTRVNASEPDTALGVKSPLRLERLRDGALIALRLDEPPEDEQLQRPLADDAGPPPAFPWIRTVANAGRGTLPTALTGPHGQSVLAIEASSGDPVGAAAYRPLGDAIASGWIHVRASWRHRGVEPCSWNGWPSRRETMAAHGCIRGARQRTSGRSGSSSVCAMLWGIASRGLRPVH